MIKVCTIFYISFLKRLRKKNSNSIRAEPTYLTLYQVCVCVCVCVFKDQIN